MAGPLYILVISATGDAFGSTMRPSSIMACFGLLRRRQSSIRRVDASQNLSVEVPVTPSGIVLVGLKHISHLLFPRHSLP